MRASARRSSGEWGSNIDSAFLRAATPRRSSRDLLRRDVSADAGRWRSDSLLQQLALGQSDRGLASMNDPEAPAGLTRQLVDLPSREPAWNTKETALDDATENELRQTGLLR